MPCVRFSADYHETIGVRIATAGPAESLANKAAAVAEKGSPGARRNH